MARERPESARAGWKSRRASARGRKSRVSPEDRAAGNIARAALIASLTSETEFNPQVAGGAEEGDDYIANLSDDDLAGYHQQLIGKPPHPKAKRQNIEKAVRKAEAERAKLSPDPGFDQSVDDVVAELQDDAAEGDV